MELNIMMARPSTLPTAAWPLAVSLPITAAPVAVLAVEQAPVSREHQVQIQAELGKAVLMFDGNKGTTGLNGSASSKRYTDGASGAPPRGRPV